MPRCGDVTRPPGPAARSLTSSGHLGDFYLSPTSRPVRKEALVKRNRYLFLPLLLMFALPAQAQEPEVQWLTIFAEHVPISDQAAFEENSRSFLSMMSDAGISDVGWATVQSQMFGYAYVMPGGPGDLAELNATWGAALAKLGDRGAESMAKGDKLVSSRDMYYIGLRTDLSYMPDRVQINAEQPFRYYTQLFVHPHKVAEFEASLSGWQSMYRDAGVEHGWRVYQYMTGTDLPAYLVVQAATSEAVFHERQAELESSFGDRIEEMRAKTGPTLRRAVNSGGWVRPDLSYPAGN